MSISYWETFRDDIVEIKCEWCNSTDDLYELDSEPVCYQCLQQDYEEPEMGLTPEERNSGEF